MSGRRLIVNADDLGRTRGINLGIALAHRRGIVTSATLMVNYPAAQEVPQLSAENPGLGIGLHLQLSGGAPLLPSERLPSLVGSDGRLPPTPEPLVAAEAAELLAEARAQLARFRELLGRDPTHFDSHHHAHRVPAVFATVVALARETGRPVRLADPSMREALRGKGIASTDRFDDSFFDQAATRETLLTILAALPSGTSELMCHPAFVDEELRATSSYAVPRARELEILTSEVVREAVRAAQIDLISFTSL